MTNLSEGGALALPLSEEELLQRAENEIARLASDPNWPHPPKSEVTAISGQAWYWRLYWYRSRFRRNPPHWVAGLDWCEQSSWIQRALDLNDPEGLSRSEWRNRAKLTSPKWADDLCDEASRLLSIEIERALEKRTWYCCSC